MLHSDGGDRSFARYTDQITYYSPQNVLHMHFSWRVALFGRYDVLHVHWPEHLLQAPTAVGRWRRRAFLLGLVLRLRLSRTVVVRTLHNDEPHDRVPPMDSLLLGVLDRCTAQYVRLNRSTSSPRPRPVVTVPHGHYREVLSRYDNAAPVAGRILHIGRLRSYKGTDELIAAFRSVDDPSMSLRIVGDGGADRAFLERIRGAGEREPRLTSVLRTVDDEELVAEITAASLIALPYRHFSNSGIALVALSLGRTILVPRMPVTEALAAEVGEEWVVLFDGQIAGHHLVRGLAATQRPRQVPPRLEGRDWHTVAEMHAALYASVVAGPSSRKGSPCT